MATAPQFHLEMATPADIPGIVRQGGRAMMYDRHTQMKAVVKGFGTQPEDVFRYHSSGIQGLESMLQNPKYDVIVAKNTDGRVIGSVTWTKRELGADQDHVRGKPDTTVLPTFEPPDINPKTIANLEKVTNAAMQHYISYLMPPGTVCRYIVGIGVDPDYQGQGVGTALIHWGTERADEEGGSCWVSSSHDGISSFQKRGFREVGRLDLCLDDWSEGHARPSSLAEDVDSKSSSDALSWGRYSWTWLVREPRSLPK